MEVNRATNSDLLSRCKGALLYKEKALYVLRSEQPGLSSACATLRRFAPHKGMHPLRRLQLSSLSKRRDEKVDGPSLCGQYKREALCKII